jgi:SAM-dependent methyltransferase
VDFERAAETAPPGWRHFTIKDVDRLPRWVRSHELARVPAAERQALADGDPESIERVIRAFFWTLVYHLEPAMWDELSRAEPIHPGLLATLPAAPHRTLEIGAGSGRLTRHLSGRGESLLAVEPAIGLLRLLRERVPSVSVTAAWAEALPVQDGWSQLTAACGLVGPDDAVLRELDRVTARGGDIVLISPECPEWFERNGWRRLTMERVEAPAHAGWIEAFFGPPDPPHELVSRHIE